MFLPSIVKAEPATLGVGINEGIGVATSGYCSNIYADILPVPGVAASFPVSQRFDLAAGVDFHWFPLPFGGSDCAGPWDALHGLVLADVALRFNQPVSERWTWFAAAGPAGGVMVHTAHSGTGHGSWTRAGPSVGFTAKTGFSVLATESARLSFGLEFQWDRNYLKLVSTSEWQTHFQASVLLGVDFALGGPFDHG